MVQTNRRHTFLSASDDFDGQGARRIRTRKLSTNKLRVQEHGKHRTWQDDFRVSHHRRVALRISHHNITKVAANIYIYRFIE
jgi:hypothetical protein